MVLLAIAALAGSPLRAKAGFITPGTTADFAVLGGTTVTNTGPTVIGGGHVGVSPGSEITGFPAGIVLAPFAVGGGNAAQAQIDLTAAYLQAAGLVPTSNLTGQDLGGLTLTPGVYSFSSSAQLTGALTLDFQGDPDAEFVFQIGSTLTTASGSSVVSINAGNGPSPGCEVFWQVGSSATLGTSTTFLGHIFALTSIALNTGATLNGSALARNGEVTLDDNRITNTHCVVPEPASITLALVGGMLVGLPGLRKKLRGKKRDGE